MADKPMKLTRLGHIANVYGTMTPPAFYQAQLRDIIRSQDEDSDWEHMMQERINGLTRLRDWVRRYGSDAMSKVAPDD